MAVAAGALAGDLALESVACNLCGDDRTRLLYEKPDTRHWMSEHVFSIVQCRSCGLGYVNPRPTRAATERFYPKKFYEGREVRQDRARYERQAAFLDDLRPGRVLDIGCAGGAFLEVLRARGWDVAGMDQYDAGGRTDIPVRLGELPDLAYPADHFDAVTSWAVFEHLHDPMAYFREVARILKPGGRFVFLVTNLRSLWSCFGYAEDVPRHLYFFSAPTLARYAAAGGLTLTRLDYSGSVLRADTSDVLRVNVLRRLGVDWRGIHGGRRGLARRAADRATVGLARVLFPHRLQVLLRVAGTIVGIMERTCSR